MKSALMLLAVMAIMTIVAAPCSGLDWKTEDTAWLAAGLAIHAADWSQTRYIAANPDKYRELNPFLGSHPSDGQVNTWFAINAVVYTGALLVINELVDRKVVDRKTARIYPMIWCGVKGGVVARNMSIGVGMKW